MKQILKIQGDVSVLSGVTIPGGMAFKPLSAEGLVVAIGESKGHRHIVIADRPSLVEVGEDAQGFFWMKIGQDANARLVHETHKPIALPPNWYRIGRQREADPIEEYRKVRD